MRYNELDLMRFVAAFGVLLYHFTARNMAKVVGNSELFQTTALFTKYGYLGVNLFFMISGFVILASALNRTGYEFAVSRFTRLYPTYWLCVTMTTIAYFIFRPDAFRIDKLTFMANLTMLNDYFNIKDIDGVYWTLHVELKYYGCIFLMIILGWLKHYRIWISIWLIATIFFLLSSQPFFMGWFIDPGYSSYFIAGTAFFLASKYGYDKYFTIIICASLVISSFNAWTQVEGFINRPQLIDRVVAVYIVWFLYFIFYAVSVRKIQMKRHALVFALGGTTYPLYLIHSSVGRAVYDPLVSYVNPYTLLVLVIMMMLGISYGIFFYFERIVSKPLKRLLLIYSPSFSGKRPVHPC